MDEIVYFFLGTIVVIIVGFLLVRYLRRTKKHLPMDILPSGWSFYFRPTSGEPPGTVFRITSDKKRFMVAFLDVKIHSHAEVTGSFKQVIKAKMNILTRFLGLKDTSLSAESEKVQALQFEMKNPIRETTTDSDIKPHLRKLVGRLRTGRAHGEAMARARMEGSRYYIIRDACKTKELNYQLTEKQVEELGGEASIRKRIKTKGKLISSKQKLSHVIKQPFDEPMRVMFNAEEIEIALMGEEKFEGFLWGGRKPEEFKTSPVREPLEWEEEGTAETQNGAIFNGARAVKKPTLKIIEPTSPKKMDIKTLKELVIKIETTPADEKVLWEIAGDKSGTLSQTEPNVFKYNPSDDLADSSVVTITFSLAKHKDVLEKLTINIKNPKSKKTESE